VWGVCMSVRFGVGIWDENWGLEEESKLVGLLTNDHNNSSVGRVRQSVRCLVLPKVH